MRGLVSEGPNEGTACQVVAEKEKERIREVGEGKRVEADLAKMEGLGKW